MRVSPHDRSQNGIAVLTSATTTSQRQLARIWTEASRVPTVNGTTSASVIAASPSRPRISVDGASSRSATLMNMNEAPQMSASATSMARFRCLTSPLVTHRKARLFRRLH